jgi:hypothetical protein
MSNVVQFNPNKAPAFAKKRGELSDVAKALMGGGGAVVAVVSASQLKAVCFVCLPTVKRLLRLKTVIWTW